jgi:hypothetical protein
MVVNADVVSSGGVTPPAEETATEKVVSTTAPTLKPLSVAVKSDSDPDIEPEVVVVKPTDNEPEIASDIKTDPEAKPVESEAPADVIPVKKTGGETVIAPPEHPQDEKPTEAVDKTNEPSSDDETKTDEKLEPTPTASPAPSESQPAGSSEATAEAEAVVAKSEAEKQAERATEAAAARVDAAEKLIADKTYFVPVGERSARRSKKHIGFKLFLCLIGLLALAYLAIDSGMIKTSVDLPVRLFRVE